MSGPIRNEWNRFLNGGTSHYNFSYRSEIVTPIEPGPSPMPVPAATPILNATSNKKSNKVVIPTQKGGKRKSRRRRSHSQKKYRLTRLTHRK
jgi:hypothetical protein